MQYYRLLLEKMFYFSEPVACNYRNQNQSPGLLSLTIMSGSRYIVYISDIYCIHQMPSGGYYGLRMSTPVQPLQCLRGFPITSLEANIL